MAYEIKFKGPEPSITVNTDRGEKIKLLVFDGKKDTPIDIDGDMFLVGNIKAVVRVPDPVPERLPEYHLQALPSGPQCRGEHSIQNEINNIAKASGAGWAKRITDKAWREQTRQKLRATTTEWCDTKENTCYCQ